MPRRSCLGDFDILATIGKGSYGSCKKVRRKLDNRIYVIKTISLEGMSVKEKDSAVRECKTLADLDCNYIIKYYDSFIEEHSLHIVMEYAANGDLQNFIRKSAGKEIPEKIIWSLLIQMLLALQYMHSRKYLHRDFKSLNVFLDKANKVKVGDLGVARKLDTESFASTMVGTPYYLSPELCENVSYNSKSDMWALGCVLYELCTGRHPFTANNQAALILKIIRGTYHPIPTSYSRTIADTIARCLNKDPAARPSADELLAKPVLRSHARKLGIDLPSVEELNKNRRVSSAKASVKVPAKTERPSSSRIRKGVPTPLRIVPVEEAQPPATPPKPAPKQASREQTPSSAAHPVTMARLKEAKRVSVDDLRRARNVASPDRPVSEPQKPQGRLRRMSGQANLLMTPSPDMGRVTPESPLLFDGVENASPEEAGQTVLIKFDKAPIETVQEEFETVEISFEETLEAILRAHQMEEQTDLEVHSDDNEEVPQAMGDSAIASLLDRQERANVQVVKLRAKLAEIVPDQGQVRRLYDYLKPICLEQRVEADDAIHRFVFGIISFQQAESVQLLYQLISAEQDAAELESAVSKVLG
ncbi:Protein kinase domain [Carpediemonas membranifera]|uniref:non-specific serine/threonine protein kinase n=1 Tax=Carpediemonas membranifera TaxID=201153 RepID=A0A8J6ATA3_9EUKA|nr:Protein kinase domain [Carpediemonas membranifera]|eukprot:KAG9391850.1 Protein kinase domain [Carpediemonas membranifera]